MKNLEMMAEELGCTYEGCDPPTGDFRFGLPSGKTVRFCIPLQMRHLGLEAELREALEAIRGQEGENDADAD